MKKIEIALKICVLDLEPFYVHRSLYAPLGSSWAKSSSSTQVILVETLKLWQ